MGDGQEVPQEFPKKNKIVPIASILCWGCGAMIEDVVLGEDNWLFCPCGTGIMKVTIWNIIPMNISAYTANQRNGITANPALLEGNNMCEGYKKYPLCDEFDTHVLQCEPDRINDIFYLGFIEGRPELMDVGFLEEFLWTGLSSVYDRPYILDYSFHHFN